MNDITPALRAKLLAILNKPLPSVEEQNEQLQDICTHLMRVCEVYEDQIIELGGIPHPPKASS